MQVLHEYRILFTVKYFSNASTRLVEVVLTRGGLSVITLFSHKTQPGTSDRTLAEILTLKRRRISIFLICNGRNARRSPARVSFKQGATFLVFPSGPTQQPAKQLRLFPIFEAQFLQGSRFSFLSYVCNTEHGKTLKAP